MPLHRRPEKAELLRRRREMHIAVEDRGLPWADGIRAMRSAMGMTQAEFGKVFRLTVRQVLELENGKANPTAETLRRLGKPFGFEVGFVKKPPAEATNRELIDPRGLPNNEIPRRAAQE